MRKSVVVTGANSGIGRACVFELAGAGFDVIGTVRSAEKARALGEEAEQSGLSIRTAVLDLGDRNDIESGVDEIETMTGGGPWGLVNNAGYAQPGAIEDVSDEQSRDQLEVNLIAPTEVTRLLLPGMRKRGEGRIVNMSSFAGLISEPFLGWYCASKRGLEAISDALRIEAAPFGVSVVVVAPGGFRSGIWERGVASLPPRELSAYAHLYGMAQTMLERSTALPGPELVARVTRRALQDTRPRCRYLVGKDVRVGSVMESMLPTKASDYVKGLTMGLHRSDDPVAKSAKRVLSHFL